MPEPLSQEEAIFYAALEIDAADQRAAYLDKACGNQEELRRRVEALLRRNAESAGPLDRPVGGPGETTAELPAERPGAMIGPYKLLEPIGEGGMGAVWMAQQTDPVKRLVALKLIKAGMDSKQVLARFEAERQALALMDHPNIAKVLDGGTTSAGRPYFVMDLVKGVPITKYCDEHHLTPWQRLELFVPVCQAVQHAHQKGVIHRDLKPSNVLVALYDSRPVPKVIDFGVAKAAGQQLTDKTLVTGFGNIVGTLEYMSPEQAEVNQLDIDTRSDIYSLGVLLYELLAGSPPFTRKELEKAGVLEMLRVIREQEPSKPSTKLSTADALPTLAANRGTDPAKLTRLVRGELDWIVMKALEKDRNRRYETANAFAADVQRYLADEPVQACPPSAAYRFGKFARRNKVALAVAALVSGALLLLLAVLAVSNIRIQQANTEMDQALVRALDEKKRADQNLARAEKAVEDYLTKVADDPRLKAADLYGFRKELLTTAIPFYEEFVRQDGDDPLLKAKQGSAYHRLALVRGDLGDKQQALADFEQARAIFNRLAADFPDDLRYRSEVAKILLNRGGVLEQLGKRADALDDFRQALALAEALVRDFPGAPEGRQSLARSQMSLGRLQRQAGRHAEAEPFYRRALALTQELAAKYPGVAEYRRSLALQQNGLGLLLQEIGRLPEAAEAFRQAVSLQEGLTREAPQVAQYRERLAGMYDNLGLVLGQLGKGKEGGDAIRKAVAIQGKLAEEFAAIPDYRLSLASTEGNLALLLRDLGERLAAEDACRQAQAHFEKLAARFPDVPKYHFGLATTLRNLGLIQYELCKYGEAEKTYAQAIAKLEKLATQSARVPEYRMELGLGYDGLGQLLYFLGRGTEGEAAFRQALAIRKKLADDHPAVPVYRQDLAATYNNLAWALGTCPDPRLRDPGRALALARKAVELLPDDANIWGGLGIAHYRAGDGKSAVAALHKCMKLRQGDDAGDWFFLAMAHRKLDQPDEARKQYDRAVAWMEKNRPSLEKNPQQAEELRRFRSEAEEVLGLKRM